MDIVNEVADEIEKRGLVKLSKHIYGLSHPLIGKPCLYEDTVFGGLKPAMPYGAYILSDNDPMYPIAKDLKGTLLSIAYYCPNSLPEGEKINVKAISAIRPNDLIPIDPTSRKGLEISHTILSWLVDNRSGTFMDAQKKELAETSLE